MNIISLITEVLFYGLSLGSLYFLIASGFSLIFGLMGVLNFAHGSLFSWGTLVCYFVWMGTGSFLFGVLCGAVAMGLLGLIIERVLIARTQGNYLATILVTFGLIYIFSTIGKIIFGNITYSARPPAWLDGSFRLITSEVPVYRGFMILCGVLIFVLMSVLLYRTKLGLIIRAGIEKPQMVNALGINLNLVFIFTFVLGSALAGLGGAIAVPYLGANATTGDGQFFYAMAVIVIGGIGNFRGSFYASLLIGVVSYLVSFFTALPPLAAIVLIMVAVLMFKPEGLFGGVK